MTCTPISRPTTSSPIRRSISRIGRASCWKRTSRWALRHAARRQRQLRLDPALHPPPCSAQRPRRRRGRLRHGQRLALTPGSGGEGEIRQRIVEADLGGLPSSRCRPSSSSPPASPPACGSSPATRPAGTSEARRARPPRRDAVHRRAQARHDADADAAACSPAANDGETLLADGMGDPKPDSDIGRIVYAFRQWRGEPAAELVGRAQHGAWPIATSPVSARLTRLRGSASTASCSLPAVTSAPRSRKTTESRSGEVPAPASRAGDVFRGRRAVDRVDPVKG